MADLNNTTVAGTGAAVVSTGTGAQRPASTATVQSFTATGPATFNVPAGVKTVEVLVVAGGGAGGGAYAGGGGAGGLVYHPAFPVTPGGSVSVSVGAGGTAGAQNGGLVGGTGGNSSFGNITALGGGGGGSYVNNIPGDIAPNTRAAINGGSGGGGAAETEAIFNYGKATQSPSGGGLGYGFPGGRGSTMASIYRGGGGGGAGEAGFPGDEFDQMGGQPYYGGRAFSPVAGNGGIGRAYDISGTSTYYAGGGGGGKYNTNGNLRAGIGGLGGGGAGQLSGPGQATAGTANTGGGGGGGGGVGSGQNGGLQGGDGGPGVVIVRYSVDAPAGTSGQGAVRFSSTTSSLQSSEKNKQVTIAGKTVTSFTSTGPATFNVPDGITNVHVLVVGAGGNGGTGGGGGGGAGGFIEEMNFPVTPGGSVAVVVGAAGPGNGASGGQSSFGSLIAYGGGGGGNYSGDDGNPGGSGGGSTGTGPGQDETQAGSGYPGQGYPGGIGRHAPGNYVAGGGGGGASHAGWPSTRDHHSGEAGKGGDGKVSYITETAVWYAGGGAGAGSNSPTFVAPVYGGVGGGGDSGPGAGNNGVANTGGGGAGGNHNGGAVGTGGPGIVIVRY